MTTLYIYDATNYQDHIDNQVRLNLPIAQFKANSNHECEKLASDENYDDSDLFAWSYTAY